MSALVYLGDDLVGELIPDPAEQRSYLTFDAGYAYRGSRPVLGRWFEDRMIDPARHVVGVPMPSYFRNLLPEGALRRMVERRLGASALPEYTMLLRLGEHLPGAVRVLSDELDLAPLEDEERRARDVSDPFRFALSGVQPKLVLAEEGDRLTVPIAKDGFWIAKFGTTAYQKLPENELAMLRWASSCGLNVPEHRIVRAAELENLPSEFEREQTVLLVRRFDRTVAGNRVHQEDFAQIFGLPPEDKYVNEAPAWVHYGSIGAVIYSLCGRHDYREYLRRLVFMVLSGNADAHVKNWGLIYPDGLHARLAPAYDFVSTLPYPTIRKHPALRWLEPAEPTMDLGAPMTEVTMNDLLVAASYTEDDTAEILDELSEFVSRVRAAWPTVEELAPANVRRAVAQHLAAAQLV